MVVAPEGYDIQYARTRVKYGCRMTAGFARYRIRIQLRGRNADILMFVTDDGASNHLTIRSPRQLQFVVRRLLGA